MRYLKKILSWLVTILLPVALTCLGVRLVLTHTFLQVEYHLPGFPADTYGFSQADRIHWSGIAWDYILNSADISFLGNLEFADGTQLYNDRELSHMKDVKNVVQTGLRVGYSVWFLILGIGLWARFGGWWSLYIHGIWRGGWVTVGLVAVIGLFAVISFWQFFTLLHSLFFTGDSWLFQYSDTLIRLFPLQFWQILFIFPVVLDVLVGLVLGICLSPKRKSGVTTGDIIPHL